MQIPRNDLSSVGQEAMEQLSTADRLRLEKLGMDLSRGVVTNFSEIRTSLIEVTPALVRLETEVKSNINGMETKSKSNTSIQAKPDDFKKQRQVWTSKDSGGSATVIRIPFSSMTPGAPPKSGQETLTVAGRQLLCSWIEQVSSLNGIELWMKSWFSNSIPGGVARRELKSEGPTGQSTTIVVTAFEMKSPKGEG
jgi:hypothetical protein